MVSRDKQALRGVDSTMRKADGQLDPVAMRTAIQFGGGKPVKVSDHAMHLAYNVQQNAE
jgi:hypothetical protein